MSDEQRPLRDILDRPTTEIRPINMCVSGVGGRIVGYAQRAKAGKRTGRVPLIERPGLICVISGDRGTYPAFAACLATLLYPPGSVVSWRTASAGGVALERSNAVYEALQRGLGWVWFIDDDHTFAPGTLLRLLEHDRDLVVPLVATRRPPFGPILYNTFPVAADMTDAQLHDALQHGYSTQSPDRPKGHRGLSEVGHSGAAGLLISAEVLQAIERPHFVFGAFDSLGAAEDTWFTLRCRRRGFKVWCDLGTPIGHLTSFAIWPTFDADDRIVPDFDAGFSHNGADDMQRRLAVRQMETTPSWFR